VFQALAQQRPYRCSLDTGQIMAILKQQVEGEKLDRQVVDCVEMHLQDCWQAAMKVMPD
jgi:HD-GYP domain-containing protein (c-di-GMP phosphodiesterase class II)